MLVGGCDQKNVSSDQPAQLGLETTFPAAAPGAVGAAAASLPLVYASGTPSNSKPESPDAGIPELPQGEPL